MSKLRLGCAVLLVAMLAAPPPAVRAVEGQGSDAVTGVPPEVWPTSPYHGVINGTGEVIPCRCRFRDSDYRLGATVCMNTHLGVQLARCDLFLNNTSWVPIGTPCTMSALPTRLAGR